MFGGCLVRAACIFGRYIFGVGGPGLLLGLHRCALVQISGKHGTVPERLLFISA